MEAANFLILCDLNCGSGTGHVGLAEEKTSLGEKRIGSGWRFEMNDMPKLECPFVRKEINGNYVCTPEITEGYDWVFEDPTVRAIEKLHGTNVSIIVENGQISSVWNRTARIPFFCKGKEHIIQGLLESFSRGYCELEDGQHFGELIGPKVNGNPYNIDKHIWIPFKTYGWGHLSYTSWGKYPKTYESISEWFKTLMPLYSMKAHGKDWKDPFVEGVVFTHPDGRMAKLRRDMFDWFDGRRHKEEI
jgi:hypothetical protein